jgi:hypothetical protein
MRKRRQIQPESDAFWHFAFTHEQAIILLSNPLVSSPCAALAVLRSIERRQGLLQKEAEANPGEWARIVWCRFLHPTL